MKFNLSCFDLLRQMSSISGENARNSSHTLLNVVPVSPNKGTVDPLGPCRASFFWEHFSEINFFVTKGGSCGLEVAHAIWILQILTLLWFFKLWRATGESKWIHCGNCKKGVSTWKLSIFKRRKEDDPTRIKTKWQSGLECQLMLLNKNDVQINKRYAGTS